MNTTELRTTLKTLSQKQRDILDQLIVAGEKSLTYTESVVLEELRKLGLVALGDTDKHYYFATRLSDYFKVRLEREFQ